VKPAGPIALQVTGLHVALSGTPVLHDVNVSIPRGRWISMVGPNGAGKSTLLSAMAGLLPVQGRVELDGEDLHAMPAAQRARQLAWMGQSEAVGDDLSALDVALLGRLPHQSWLSGLDANDYAQAEQALRSMHAWQWRDRYVGTLSGGERQRVLLARALAVQAPVLLLDEPLANLDPPHQADWLQLVRALVAQGRTVVSVLHEITMALQADDMVVMAQGRIAHHGPCADAQTHRAVEQVFDQRLVIHALADQWVALPSNM
jgi:iron complex transport system ATP-binding protein